MTLLYLAMQVCHVIIYIQEGSRFDTQILKRFRVLQAAKHAITSHMKLRTTPPLTTNPHASSTSRMSASGASSNNPSPGRGRGIFNRNASTITLMHGVGSYSSLLPGQCTPVIMFVFLDDFTDASPSSSSQEQVETYSLNQSLSSSNMLKPSLAAKGSGSVVVLARPVHKLEGSLRKKLQSSLESQIRSLIKRSRILSGSETGQSGSRTGGPSSLIPLFLLDSSRAVGLVDLASNLAGESLEFASGLVEDVLDGKATSDSLLLESNSQNANKDDIVSVKEFIFRQSDILRGRGGMVSSTNSGSAAGVGMVAVAAAAAAASAASIKTYSSPELPSFETWLSSSQPILHGILSAKPGGIDEAEVHKVKPHHRNGVLAPVEGNASKATDHLQLAVSFLESGGRLNSKFSTLWCEKALPIAKEIYLNELPPSYPTSQHQAHLERALFAFNSMVKGPAAQLYTKKLEEECLSIWSSGRQLCDAVSLTGKPCMHNRHNLETNGFLSSNATKSHSSGYVFLHACACGRSRRLRDDPFDFETANATFNSFLECDKLLPSLELPQGSSKGLTKHLSWCFIRIGGARYYSPAKGLLQSGFCTNHKFLLKWTISIGKQRSTSLPFSNEQQIPGNQLSSSNKDGSMVVTNMKRTVDAPFRPGDVQVEIQRRHSPNDIKSDDKTFSSGRAISNSITRKPFSEVVAGSGASSGFPPLQTRKQPLAGPDKVSKCHSIKDQGLEKVKETANNQESQKAQDTFAIDGKSEQNVSNVDRHSDDDPFLQIGSNVVPVNMNTGKLLKGCNLPKEVTLYVGFEHECPHGHRFMLRPDHLNDLGSPYAAPEETIQLLSSEGKDHKTGDHSKLAKNNGHTKARRHSNGVIDMSLCKSRNQDESNPRDAITNLYVDGPRQISSSSKEQIGDAKLILMRDLEDGLESLCLDDGGYAFNLLNRSLPIYMNCPHCRDSKRKKDTAATKFAGTISQLQRIFMVCDRNLTFIEYF